MRFSLRDRPVASEILEGASPIKAPDEASGEESKRATRLAALAGRLLIRGLPPADAVSTQMVLLPRL